MEGGEKAKGEFLSEAQELVDGLGRDVLLLDDHLRKGPPDPDLVNDVFRAVHTLKGLSGLFGANAIAGLSHELEEVLDDLRLGRLALDERVLDLLFSAVDVYGKLLSAAKGEIPEPAEEASALLRELGLIAQAGGTAGAGAIALFDLDPSVLSVLTEYEEHRLRTTLQQGSFLYRLRAAFPLATIDTALDDLKARAKPIGEILTYLPTGDGGDLDSVDLEILLASKLDFGTVHRALASERLVVEEVRRRAALSSPPAMVDSALPPPTKAIESYAPTRFPGPLETPSIGPPDRPAGFDDAYARYDAKSSIPPPLTNREGTSASLVPPPPDRAQGAVFRDLSLRSVSQTVRVDIKKLDRLMNVVGELAIVRGAINRFSDRLRQQPELAKMGRELARLHRTFERQLLSLQNGILEVRMVPLGQVFDKLGRVVRQISREQNRQVSFVVTGAETEIDKLIVEELSDPLMHMIRNALDHGIESSAERERVGKPETGTVALNAFQKGNHVVIEVEDDGRGIDPEIVRAAAERRGLIEPGEAEALTRKDLLNLVFTPGFSTRDEATTLSGRGVGMDVVKTNISRLGGVVAITSEVGIGTKITITLPITLAIISVLLVRVLGETYCLPLANVEEAILLDPRAIRPIDGREMLDQRGRTVPLLRLRKLFGATEAPGGERAFVVFVNLGERRVGLVVDRLLGQEDIVIKPLGKMLSRVRGFAGASELGDQRVGLVIDVGQLVDETTTSSELRRPLSVFPGSDA